MTTTERTKPQQAHGRVSSERFHEAVPSTTIPQRIRATARQQAKEIGLAVARRAPRVGRVLERARTQPLRSSAVRMYQWWKAPYGTASKPASLGEIPWDYVESNQDTIPFRGLREYWYPALESRQLHHNEPQPVTLLGDNLVFFRTADGSPSALENRCPHRSALLSLGQVGVFEPGTLTCRYHGMTFDGSGSCVAYLGDGPESPAVGKIRARHYPVEEHRGIVWVYMGERDPEPLLDFQPHARSVLAQQSLMVQQVDLPYNHLNMLDNATDMTHVGCLHRTCLLFAGQKPYGEVDAEPLPGTEQHGGGLHAYYTDPDPHSGGFYIDHVEWYLPNLVYHAPGDLGGGLGEGWFWFVPRDVGSFTGWFIIGSESRGGWLRRTAMSSVTNLFFGRAFGRLIYPWPGSAMSCLLGGDAPMQASQGRVVRWDHDRLTRGDRSVGKARKMIKDAHAAEVAERKQRAEAKSPPRTRRTRGGERGEGGA